MESNTTNLVKPPAYVSALPGYNGEPVWVGSPVSRVAVYVTHFSAWRVTGKDEGTLLRESDSPSRLMAKYLKLWGHGVEAWHKDVQGGYFVDFIAWHHWRGVRTFRATAAFLEIGPVRALEVFITGFFYHPYVVRDATWREKCLWYGLDRCEMRLLSREIRVRMVCDSNHFDVVRWSYRNDPACGTTTFSVEEL